jgi:hypothetical protein
LAVKNPINFKKWLKESLLMGLGEKREKEGIGESGSLRIIHEVPI